MLFLLLFQEGKRLLVNARIQYSYICVTRLMMLCTRTLAMRYTTADTVLLKVAGEKPLLQAVYMHENDAALDFNTRRDIAHVTRV